MAPVENLSLFHVIMALAGSSVLGAAATEMLRKLRSKEDKAAIAAMTSRDKAHGEAAVIGAMASAFTGTTGALREEIERMQMMLNELRTRVVEADVEIRAAAAREAALDGLVADLRGQLDASHADVARLRAERQESQARVVQQEGEIRQGHAIVEATRRVESK